MPATDYSKWNRMALDTSDDDDEAPVPGQSTQQQRPAGTPAELLARMETAERLGEDVLTERSQMVELDRRRNANREALASMRREERQGTLEPSSAKHWVCMGDTFLRQPHGSARRMLEEDQERIDAEMETLRASVKTKTSRLCELDPSIAGDSNVHKAFVNLHGVSASELAGFVER